MKNIAVWKVVLLTFVTLSIYAIYWAAVRRNYLAKHNKTAGKLPHWVWLILIPILSALIVISWLVIFILIVVNALPIDVYDGSVYILTALLYAIPLVIGLWWLWYFGKAIETVTQGKMPRIWTLFLYIFVGPFVIAFHQYYLNRLGALQKNEAYDVSPGLVVLAAVFGILSIAGLISSTASLPSEVAEVRVEVVKAQDSFKESSRLLEEYTTCMNELNEKFPEGSLTEENQVEYDAAYGACEEKYDAYVKSYKL